MTVYELIHKLSNYPPNVDVYLVPQRRKKWDMKNRQRAGYVFDRGFKPMSGDEPCIEIAGVSDETI